MPLHERIHRRKGIGKDLGAVLTMLVHIIDPAVLVHVNRTYSVAAIICPVAVYPAFSTGRDDDP
jgi:hypothetical protein